jgi:hypothetical protein
MLSCLSCTLLCSACLSALIVSSPPQATPSRGALAASSAPPPTRPSTSGSAPSPAGAPSSMSYAPSIFRPAPPSASLIAAPLADAAAIAITSIASASRPAARAPKAADHGGDAEMKSQESKEEKEKNEDVSQPQTASEVSCGDDCADAPSFCCVVDSRPVPTQRMRSTKARQTQNPCQMH